MEQWHPTLACPSIALPFRSHILNHSPDLSPDLSDRCRSLDITSHFKPLSAGLFLSAASFHQLCHLIRDDALPLAPWATGEQ